jgi:hydrogenase nickel incorporation protein HypA/HybF
MHEASIVQGLMRILTAKASEHGVDRILTVQVKIGRLRGIDSRQIRSCFEIFAEGTAAEGARLDIVEITPEAQCRACGHRYEVQRYRFLCPACGGTDADVGKGRELYIDSFTCQREPDSAADPEPPTNRA